MAVACFKWNDPVVSRAGRILRFCARRILRRIGHPAQNLGSCAELSKIDQLAQKMLDFVDFLLRNPNISLILTLTAAKNTSIMQFWRNINETISCYGHELCAFDC